MTDILQELGAAPEVKNLVFLGEAGCGKSETALNLACRLAAEGKEVHFFDLDMTKPLFRSRDAAAMLEGVGVTVHFQEQFMDAPTLTGGVTRLLREQGCYTVLDVGGDYIGARSIGGYAPFLNRDDTAVYYVINPFRPWSGDIDHIDRVLGQTLGVSHVQLERLRLVCNPNLGRDTTAADVAEGFAQVREQTAPYKPLDFCCVWEALAAQTELPVPVLPLKLYIRYPWAEDGPSFE